MIKGKHDQAYKRFSAVLHLWVCLSLLGLPSGLNVAPQEAGMGMRPSTPLLEPSSLRNHWHAPSKSSVERGSFTLPRRALAPIYEQLAQPALKNPRAFKPKLVRLGKLQLEGG